MPKKPAAEPASYEQALEELEQLVGRIESGQMPLDQLLAAQSYPSDPMEVDRFYVTSKYLTGYLLLRQPREKWDAFFARLLAGDDATAALLETYGWTDAAALEKSFAQFAR